MYRPAEKSKDLRGVYKPKGSLLVLFLWVGLIISGSPYRSLAQQSDELSAPNELELELEGNLLTIELNLDGAETVGFVNFPLTRDEKAAIEDALYRLRDVRRLFAFPQVAGCISDMYEMDSDPLGSVQQQLALLATYRFICKSPRSLNRIKLLCFEKFPNLTVIKATAKGHWGELSTLSTPSNPMLLLEKNN